jgi:ankyrin repeat protein
LHAASRRGHLEVVELLLRAGANVDMLNKAHKTAAELASENGQAGIAKFIADYNACGNGRNKVRLTTLDTVPAALTRREGRGCDFQSRDIAKRGKMTS